MSRSLFWSSDEAWAAIEPHLPKNQSGARRVDDRRVISGVNNAHARIAFGDLSPSFSQVGSSVAAFDIVKGAFMKVFRRFTYFRKSRWPSLPMVDSVSLSQHTAPTIITPQFGCVTMWV